MERIRVSDVQQINALWKEYAASWNAGDMDRWISLWVEDGIQMPPGAPRRLGKDQIKAGNQPLHNQFDWQIAIYPDEVQVLGDRAYSHGLYERAMTPKGGGETLKGDGKSLTILQRQVDGSWKIVIECFNGNSPSG